MARQRARESKQGLVISLVFAILLVIGLGVATYFQSNAATLAQQEAKKAKDETATTKDDRDWYKFQALLYRSYMGQVEGMDLAELGTLRNQFELGSIPKSSSDKDVVTKLIRETMDRKLLWEPAQNRPRLTYEAVIQKEKERNDAFEKQTADAVAAKEAAERLAKKASDELKAERGTFDQKLVDLNKKSEADMSKYLETINELRSDLTRMSEKNEQLTKTGNEDRKNSENTIAKAKSENTELKKQVEVKNEQFQELKNKGIELAPKDWQTDWRIVSIDRSGQQPFINLGSADRVHPLLTFSIHGRGPDGRPLPEAKGSLEVINVVQDHLSQARILTVKDRAKDPILKGDILYNPSWSPTAKKHIALAGAMDLLGNGTDATLELIRNLEQQNVVVDAYVDPKENVVKGKGITVQTDYVIIPELEGERAAQNPVFLENQGKRTEEIGKILKAAKENAVQVIKLPKYLEQIGYRMPHSTTEQGAPDRTQTPAAAPGATPPAGEPAEGGAKKEDDKPAGDAKPKPDDKPK
jgi:hypothetical protein